MLAQSHCPNPDDLSLFLVGRLAETDSARVEEHLSECPDCQARIEQLRPDDTLLTALVGGKETLPHDQELTVEAFIQRVAQRPIVPSDLPPETVALGSEQVGSVVLPAVQAPVAVSPEGYELRGVLGQGGMGIVYEGFDPKLRRAVAIKVMKAELAREPVARDRFLREARAAAALQHENIVAVYFVGELTSAGGQCLPYLVMPLLAGRSLETLLRERGRLPEPLVREIGRQIARGLRAAHEHGLVHRDIKPGNIWLEGNWDHGGAPPAPDQDSPAPTIEWGGVKVLDFGLVRQVGGEDGASVQGSIVGTPAYMAPEQAAGLSIDARADLFSLGCVLYRMATGQPAFRGEGLMDALRSVALDEPPPVRQLNPDLSAELAVLIHRLLAKRPGDRPASARETLDELRERSLARPQRRIPRWQQVALGCAAAAVLVLAGVFVVKITRDGKQTEVEAPGGAQIVIKQNGDIQVDLPKNAKDLLEIGEVRRFGAPYYPIIRLAVSRDGRHALTAGADGTARYWEVATGKLVHRLPSLGGEVFDVAISADGKKLLSCGDDKLIHVWDATTGMEIKQLKGHLSQVLGVSFTADSKFVASGSWDGTVRLWDLAKGQEIHSFEHRTHGGSQGVAFSPDGSLLASWGEDRTVRLYDVKQRKEVHCLRGHGSRVRAGTFSTDGKHFLSGSFAPGGIGNLCLWDVQTGKLLRSIDNIPGGSHGVALAADGVRALSGGPTGVPYLWDLETGRKIAEFSGHDPGDMVNDVAFLPDGRHALSASGLGTIRLWKLPRVADTEIRP